MLFATQGVFLQIWSPSLYSYSTGKANSGSSAAVAEQPAPMLLIYTAVEMSILQYFHSRVLLL